MATGRQARARRGVPPATLLITGLASCAACLLLLVFVTLSTLQPRGERTLREELGEELQRGGAIPVSWVEPQAVPAPACPPQLPCPDAPACPPQQQCPPPPVCPPTPPVQPVQPVQAPPPPLPPPTGKPWLVIGIPTTPRDGHIDYLAHTLNYLLDQLPANPASPMYGKVKILVLNNAHGKPHPVFDKAKAEYSQHPKALYLEFAVNNNPAGDNLQQRGSPNVPGPKVRQQTRDVADLLELAADKGTYFLFMEEDFRLCPQGMFALQYLVDKANRLYPNWIVLRVSYGLNGAVIHSSDAATLAAYYRKHVARRPPDHMLVEWYAAETVESKSYVKDRTHVTFRHNLLEHFGTVSSLRKQRMGQFAGCYDTMDAGVLFEVEAFQVRQCGHDDITPCPAKDADVPAIHWEDLRRKIKRHPK